MSWTKRQLVVQAFEEVGLAAYVFDLTPDQLQSAMRRLDSMMSTWNAKGIRVGYPMPNSPQDGDLDDETNMPDSATEAVCLNLGLRIAPGFGKLVSPETKIAAKDAYNTLLGRATMPPEMQLNRTIPGGAGYKNIDRPFMPNLIDPVTTGPDGELEFN
jgi:hypothetical protein